MNDFFDNKMSEIINCIQSILDNQAKSYGILNHVKRAFNLESVHYEIGPLDESNGIILSFFLILFNFKFIEIF